VRFNRLSKSLEHGRMTSLSDILTLGLVLVLLFGAIALYLYTRIQQAEQKISLLESILLDIKMSTEIKSYSELPASNTTHDHTDSYAPFNDDNDEDDDFADESAAVAKPSTPTPSVSSKHDDTIEEVNEVDQYKSVIAEAVNNDEVEETTGSLAAVDASHTSKVSVNYEAMTLKELQTLAKSRGITGAGSMKKGPIIEALKTSDRAPGPGSLGSGSFLETSANFGEETH